METQFSTDLCKMEKDLSLYHIKLIAFAKQAHLELKHNIARLFEALSFSKQVQALLILKQRGCVNDTKRNMGNCLNKSETCDGFQASDICKTDIIQILEEIETKSRNLYACAMDSLDAGRDISLGIINVCSKCGYLLAGDAPKECIICHSPTGYFRQY
jgi:Rubrerythrin